MRADVGVIEALAYDVLPPREVGDEQIAGQRVRQLHHIPILIGLSHFISLIACFLSGDRIDNMAGLGLIATLVGVDILAFAMVSIGGRIGIPPHMSTRLLTIYVAFCAAAWTYFAANMFSAAHSHELVVTAAVVGGGVIAMAIAAITAPPIAIIMGLSAATTTMALAYSDAVVAGICIMALVVSAYATAFSRTSIATARRRLILDSEAHQALRFVNEFEASGRGWFWETDSSGTLSYVSRQLAEDFDCDPADLLGRKFTDLLSVDSQPGEELRDERTLGFHLSARFPFSDVVVRAASDEDVLWSVSGNPIFSENGRFLGFRGIGADLTEQRRNEQEISRLARFDSLTGLPNRAMMRQTLEEALRNAARRKRGCTLFLIDLDRFKNVNDTLGHPVGDQLLRQVADRFSRTLGNHGQVGRLGGDEFIAVLPGVVETGFIERLATLMIEQASQAYQIEGHRVTIGASIGIAMADPQRACADSLTRNADLALYAAKAAGRGKHCFFEPSMHSEASDRQRLETDLRFALEQNELSLHFQPIVRAASEDLCGFEALIRWDHPTRGRVSPDLFISVAEECGLIGKLGDYVIEEAIRQAAEWPDHVRVAINLSPIQFNDPKLVEKVATLLQTHEVRADRIELEITEGVFLADNEATDDTFARLKNIGVRLALDDFGTGYSSLGYLKTAPFDKIKIDQSFVRGASHPKSRNSAIIRAIVALADSLGMDTTAEGVETHDDLNLIRELGCSQIQGYIFGKPSPAEDCADMIERDSVLPQGHRSVREPRHRLMRRGLVSIGGEQVEIRLRNISAMGALIECAKPVAPGTQLTLDIIGTGPVVGTVRWSQAGRFGIQFDAQFDLTRLAPPRRQMTGATHSFSAPFYVGEKESA
ncbi:EAL domain-containing protein [Sphingomicrobium sediminis]|uniref:EAL domain-containing protein n=1 Tax=Sphingomicrobium sediminis TaxID=2950949 RepID=A0A9X2EE60_9SPHN|nr:EAL domain-containing protein [Sphingomicrobium sediminis]MCM8556363.1 EAL domain-containing protein [Sphingomicrobium sediminis]